VAVVALTFAPSIKWSIKALSKYFVVASRIRGEVGSKCQRGIWY